MSLKWGFYTRLMKWIVAGLECIRYKLELSFSKSGFIIGM